LLSNQRTIMVTDAVRLF
jgi:hypothetical protein